MCGSKLIYQRYANDLFDLCLFYLTQVKIWFQNRRTKWKKMEGISNAEAAEHKIGGPKHIDTIRQKQTKNQEVRQNGDISQTMELVKDKATNNCSKTLREDTGPKGNLRTSERQDCPVPPPIPVLKAGCSVPPTLPITKSGLCQTFQREEYSVTTTDKELKPNSSDEVLPKGRDCIREHVTLQQQKDTCSSSTTVLQTSRLAVLDHERANSDKSGQENVTSELREETPSEMACSKVQDVSIQSCQNTGRN